MATPYFNKCVVRGRIREAKFRKTKENKRPYADLQVMCSSGRYGDVLAFGRLWGAETIEGFRKAYKEAPDSAFRFTGQVQQYRKDGRVLTAFHFFRFEGFAPTEADPARASFILKGKLLGKDFPMDEDVTVLRMEVGKYEQENKKETFEVYAAPLAAEVAEIGKILQTNGHLVDVDAEFGGSGNQRPVAEVLRMTG